MSGLPASVELIMENDKKLQVKDLLPFWENVEKARNEANKKGKGLDGSIIILLKPRKERIPHQYGGELRKANGEIYFLTSSSSFRKSFGGGTEVMWFGIYIASNAKSNTPYTLFM